MSVRWTLALVLALLLAIPANGASVRTTWRADDAEAIARGLLADPTIRAAADERAPFALRVDVAGGADATFLYDGTLARADAAPDYTARLSRDAALAALNAPDPARALRCLFDAGALAVEAPRAHERLALRAAPAGEPCAPPAHAREVAPGLYLAEGIAYDHLGIPLGWQDADAPRWLGRPDAGIARLAPAQMPRADVDLADPWRAAAAPQMRAIVASALDCPCEATSALLPAGDWRAALAADPRAREGEESG